MQGSGTPDRTPVSAIAREWAWQQDVTPPARKLVLLAVCERVNHGTGIAWPGADDIARRCGLERRMAHYHLTALTNLGLLVVVERRHGKGRPYPVYTVPPLVQLAAQSPQENGALSAMERTKLVQPTAQTFVQPVAQEPLTTEPTTVDPVVGERSHRGEKDPPAPQTPQPSKPKPPKQQRIADVIDAITGAGVKAPRVAPRDAFAVNGCDAPASEIAECFVAMATGQWPERPQDRAFARSNLSLRYAVDRLTAYQQRSAAGRPTAAALLD